MPERKIEYETVNHKADTGFRVQAPSWERLYVDAGLALTDLIAKIERIEPLEKRTVGISATPREQLMQVWLQSVLSLFETDRFVARRIVFDSFDGTKIKATLTGETYNPARHGGSTETRSIRASGVEIGEASLPEPHFFAKIFLG